MSPAGPFLPPLEAGRGSLQPVAVGYSHMRRSMMLFGVPRQVVWLGCSRVVRDEIRPAAIYRNACVSLLKTVFKWMKNAFNYFDFQASHR